MAFLLFIIIHASPSLAEEPSLPKLRMDHGLGCSNLAPVTNECVEAGLRQQREAMRRLPAYRGNTPEIHISLARLFMQQGDPNGAIEEYHSAIRLNPEMAAAFREMGAVYLDTHEWNLAKEALEKSIHLDETDSQTYYWLGRALLAQQQFPKAVEAFSKAAHLDSRTAETFSDLALAFMAQGANKQAEDALRKAIALKPDLAEAHHRLEVVRSANNDPVYLIKSTEQVLDIYFRRE